MDTYKIKYQYMNEHGNWSIPVTATLEANNSIEVRERIKAQFGPSNVRIMLVTKENTAKRVPIQQGSKSSNNSSDDSGAILLFVVVLGVVIAILPILTAISFIAPIVNISLLSNHPIFIAIITTLCLLLVIYKLWRLRGVLVYGILSLIFAIAVFFFNESNTVLATIYNTLTTFWSSL